MCIPVVGCTTAHLVSGGSAFLENVDGEGLPVSGLVESLLGLGNAWFPLITEPAVYRLLADRNIDHKEEAANSIPEVKWLAVESAAVQEIIC